MKMYCNIFFSDIESSINHIKELINNLDLFITQTEKFILDARKLEISSSVDESIADLREVLEVKKEQRYLFGKQLEECLLQVKKGQHCGEKGREKIQQSTNSINSGREKDIKKEKEQEI